MSEAIKPGLSEGFSGGAIRAGGPVSPSAVVTPRVWPALIVVAIQWAALILPARLAPGEMIAFFGFMIAVYGGLGGFLIWWLFFSRVRWVDVGVGLLAIAIGLAAVAIGGHSSLQQMGGFPVIMFVAPMVTTAIIVWLGVTPFLNWNVRRAGMILAIFAVCGYYLTMRIDGMDGVFRATWRPRWKTTDEDRFLAATIGKGEVALTPLVAREGDWPAFRGGLARDGVCRDVAFQTDWSTHPPKLLWKHPVGPGWSSFAVIGNRIFTQEQRGPSEVVVCYDADTGHQIWEHKDPARFTELVAGPGPRATPTFHEGKLYTQGATGKLNCLDARTGAPIWSRDIEKDSKSETPTWGFAASPLVMDGVVTVYGGAKDKAVLAYDAATGAELWQRGDGDKSYCSTQVARIDGVDQLLFVTNLGVFALEPKTGVELWNHKWELKGGMARCTQANVVGSDVLFGTGFDEGTRRVHIERKDNGWDTKELWTSRALRPYFNDFVVHNDHIYGFDGPFFVCVDLKDGKSKWRQRGYGNGQVLLLPKQNLLLILSEGGDDETTEVALLDATPAGPKEIAKMPALEGKTWNHPVVANGRLFIRNGREAACFQLTPLAEEKGKMP